MISQRHLIFLLLTFYVASYSQSTCTNSDFETGTLNGWSGSTGGCCPIATPLQGFISGRHTIMSGTGTDINTCNVVPYVAPGGIYSARLGNDNNGAEAETLSYSITVDPSNSLFIYKYAVVLEDPDHLPEEQPRFQLKVLDNAGNLIDPVCGQYTVVASASIPGFQSCGSIRYKNWTTVGLNLTPYIGQQITIEFSTGDCSLGGHFGYAYVDAFCSPLQITSNFCVGAVSTVLNAPEGFTYLWNTGATSQSITVTDSTQGTVYSCQLTSVTGCIVNISTQITLVQPQATFNIVNTCYSNAIFTNTTSIPAGITLDTFYWDFGDGTTSTLQNPVHSYSAPGNYTVTFTISNSQGCTTSTSSVVTVYQEPTAAISYSSNSYCTQISTPQPINLSGTYLYTGGVFSAPLGLTIDSVSGSIIPSSSTPGQYIVTYTIPTNNNCTVPPVTTNVTITAAPTANIIYIGQPFCVTTSSQQSVSLTGTGTYIGGLYTSSSGLDLNQNTGSINPSNTIPGTYIVTYNIPSTNECPVIPTSTTVTITSLPTATISYNGGPFCTTISTPQPINLSGTGSYLGGSFSSSSGLDLNATSGSIIPSNSIPGNYVVSYTVPATGGCGTVVVNTNLTITALPTVNITYSSSFFCKINSQNQNVTLTGTGLYLGGTFTSSPGLSLNPNTGTINPSGSSPGTYTVTYTTLSSGNCPNVSVSNIVTIVEPVLPPADAFQFFCASDNPTISDLLPNSAQITWYSSSSGGSPLSLTTSLTNNLSYYATVTDLATGCQSTTRLMVTISIIDLPQPDVAEIQTFCLEDQPTVFNLTSSTQYNTTWYDTPQYGSPLLPNTLLTHLQNLYAASYDESNGCYSSLRSKVLVNLVPCTISLNNILTLNDNALNDHIVIENIEYFPKNEFQIFNRYGKLVWRGYNYNNNLNTFIGRSNVQGTYKFDEFLPTGTYFYVLTYFNMYRNKNEEIKGFLQINNNQ